MRKLLILTFIFLIGCQPVNKTIDKNTENAMCVSGAVGCDVYRFVDYQYNKICYYTIRGGIWCQDLEK